jgi:hypothetical protein
MKNYGEDFKAPRKQADNQWKKLEILAQGDNLFKSCGCGGPGYRPKTFSEAKRDHWEIKRYRWTQNKTIRP